MALSLEAQWEWYRPGKLPAGLALVCLLLAICIGQPASAQMPTRITVGEVEYYGYGGLDLDKIKTALPIKAGDVISAAKMTDTLHQTSVAIQKITGHSATDVAPVCCDPQGGWTFYIGLSGTSSHPFSYNPKPTGSAKLPAKVFDLYHRLMDATMKAVEAGHAKEDDSQGYALMTDPAARSLEMSIHQYALTHTADLCHVLTSSASVDQRQVSAEALGYAPQSSQQIQALVHASRDPDNTVRNNATRALAVMVQGRPQVASQIPISPFIAMIYSGVWTDRNKGSFLLYALSADRNPQVLHQLREEAMPALLEMAHWDANHAGAALTILGRIGNIPDNKLAEMMQANQVDEIVTAAQGNTTASPSDLPPTAAAPAIPVHLTITGTQTKLADALSTLAHQTGTTILTESTLPGTPLAAGDLTQPSLEAMLTQLTSTIPGTVWEKVTLPQGQPVPTADVLAGIMRILESVSATQITAQNPAAQTSLLFSKTSVTNGTTTVTTTGTQTIYLIRSTDTVPAVPSTPSTQAVSNLKSIADLFGQMTPDQQKQAIPLMIPEIMRLIQNMDPSVRAQLFSQLSLGAGN